MRSALACIQGRGNDQTGQRPIQDLLGGHRYTHLKEKHRLTNIGNENLVLIEAQRREYSGKNDIVGLANTCGRV